MILFRIFTQKTELKWKWNKVPRRVKSGKAVNGIQILRFGILSVFYTAVLWFFKDELAEQTKNLSLKEMKPENMTPEQRGMAFEEYIDVSSFAVCPFYR